MRHSPSIEEHGDSLVTPSQIARYRQIDSMRRLRKIGHITPSCNTVLEPVTSMINVTVSDEISHHFARIPVENISLLDADVGQFDIDTMVRAAELICDGDMDAIVWNGTSGCWNGPDSDEAICEAVTAATGVLMSTSTLAQLEALRRFEITRFGLAVPYMDDVAARTIETYGAAGFEAVSHANLGMAVGRDMANVPLAIIRDLLRAANSPDAQCLVVICTGLPAALVVEEMESELGKPIFDSVAVTFTKGLELVRSARTISHWGSLLRGESAVRELLQTRLT
jgi:maleate isomerase